ncbi:Fe(3+) ABC transporter substrate-binding protein [Paenibacillus xerothermodurans]|uniref:Fe(3+) ABC transporter substrate-binding protein n=1 Tax=Paenibacillus xerothermodurans TaxID=1977292 RepID=A0A2W1NK86_PAEXE|nr:Fe(3+) ABC transporter substrate-binding protein [Paenibacillus xerothermodurans]PZE19473.1 Fe(3+) ABC transporter substrate-binding protein [Paenibacillus xerothermodurans]
MQHRKFSSVIISAVMGLALLSGCAGGQSAQPSNGAGTAEKTPEQPAAANSQVVNVYTARHYAADEALYNQFTEKTGIKVNVVKGKAEELIERIKREGESTEADLFITVDGGVLNNAKQAGILQPAQSAVIDQNVPKQYRDTDNQWIGLATRARVIVYAKDRVKPEQLSTYEDLASDKWKGKLLVNSSTVMYNQSLFASLIELNGEQKAEEWAKGVAANMARAPKGGDRDQAKAIVAGEGDVGIMNTYYVGLLLNSKDAEEVKVGNSIGVHFPNQSTTGTHLNISGAGLIKDSKNKENAVKLIEYLTSAEAQTQLSKANFEYPVNPAATKAELLTQWGEFKPQQIDFAKLGTNNAKAIEIFNKVGWK